MQDDVVVLESIVWDIPKEGEQIDVRGGVGNRLILQAKRENGIVYCRLKSDEEWQEFFPKIEKTVVKNY